MNLPSFDLLGVLFYAGITALSQYLFRSFALLYRILASTVISIGIVVFIAILSGHEFHYFSRENILAFVIGLSGGLVCSFALRFLWLKIQCGEPREPGPGSINSGFPPLPPSRSENTRRVESVEMTKGGNDEDLK